MTKYSSCNEKTIHGPIYEQTCEIDCAVKNVMFHCYEYEDEITDLNL